MLKDLLRASRSYRSFDTSVTIPNSLLRDWIDHTRYCPSSINLQMLKFHIVNDKDTCSKVLSQTRWAAKLKDISLPPKGHEPVAYIIICADKSVTEQAPNFAKDVGICAQTLMLAAAECDLGGCMVGSFSSEALSQALSLPEHLIPQLVLGFGKPDEEVRIVPPAEDGSVTYYRDGNIHYVQKRDLNDLII